MGGAGPSGPFPPYPPFTLATTCKVVAHVDVGVAVQGIHEFIPAIIYNNKPAAGIRGVEGALPLLTNKKDTLKVLSIPPRHRVPPAGPAEGHYARA